MDQFFRCFKINEGMTRFVLFGQHNSELYLFLYIYIFFHFKNLNINSINIQYIYFLFNL
jgi:hypothetical protein